MSASYKLLAFAIAAALSGTATAAVGSNDPAAGRALTLIKLNTVPTRTSTGDAFIARDVVIDTKTGTEHVRFDRTYNGLRVLGGDLVVHSRAGTFKGASVTLPAPLSVPTAAKISTTAAISTANAQFGLVTTSAPTAQLLVYARNTTPKLAYDVLLVGKRKDQTPTRMHYIVDANTGAVLSRWDDVHTGTVPASGTPTYTPAVGSGKSLMSGTVPLNTAFNGRLFEMKDMTRGGTWTMDYANTFRDETAVKLLDANNQWGNGARSDRATIAVDATWGIATTWDYFKNVHGRLGVNNDGAGTMNAVHYQQGYNNAFWLDSCAPLSPNGCMVFGDGDGVNWNPVVMLDVTGHEMSHGVTWRTAGLIYSGASGGLNEATSDIFGTMVEFYANNPNNPPNYMIGEKLAISNPDGTLALRYMFKPSLDGISPDCYPANDPREGYEDFFNNWMDPHFNSGVANHFFYLLAEGAVVPAGFAGAPYNLTPASLVCNGNTALVKIGRQAAQQIWYRALTVYMTSGTNYQGARAATLSAATDLYGAGSAQYNAVAAAWSAVSVN